MATERHASGLTLEYTPGSDVESGDPVQIAGLAGIVVSDADSGDDATVAISGLYRGDAIKDTAISAGDVVGWDADGTNQDDGTGCVTNVATSWDYRLGVAVYDAVSGASDVKFDLNRFSLSQSSTEASDVQVTTGAATDFEDYIFVAPGNCEIVEVLVATDTACSGDDASNYWELQVQNLTDAEALISSPLNTGDDSVLNTADQADALGVDQNADLEASDLLELQVSETGTATDLSSAVIHVSVRYRLL